MISKSDQWALITGASSGIGYEIAKILASKDRNLILVSRNEERLNQVAQEFNRVSHMITMPLDLSVKGSGRRLYEECERLGLNIEILINNAGFGKFGASTDLSPEVIESMLTLNMITLTSLANMFGAKMKEKGHGYILNIASTAGFQPIPYLSAYSASKTYVQSFTQALRAELKRFGVKVTYLAPGATKTNFLNVALEDHPGKFMRNQHLMDAHEVAFLGLKAMFKGKKMAVPGAPNKIQRAFSNFIPASLVERILRTDLKPGK